MYQITVFKVAPTCSNSLTFSWWNDLEDLSGLLVVVIFSDKDRQHQVFLCTSKHLPQTRGSPNIGYTPEFLSSFSQRNNDTSGRSLYPSPGRTDPPTVFSGNSRVVVGRSRGIGPRESNEDFAEAPLTSEGHGAAMVHDGSMVLLYMVTWIPSIYPSHVSIYTSTMDPIGGGLFGTGPVI